MGDKQATATGHGGARQKSGEGNFYPKNSIRGGIYKEFYQELRKSGKEGTWQVFAQELDLMVRLRGTLDCCPRYASGLMPLLHGIFRSLGWGGVLGGNSHPCLFLFLISCFPDYFFSRYFMSPSW
jgi:hypothetical protein